MPVADYLALFVARSCQSDDRFAEGDPAVCEGVGAGEVPKRQAGQYAGRLELAQPGRKLVRRYPEVAPQIAVALWTVEQPLHDEQGPPCPDEFESRGEVAHGFGSTSGFIQNGE